MAGPLDDPDEDYGDFTPPPVDDVTPQAPERRPSGGAAPVMVTGDLEGAETALERAQEDHDAAQDALADLEGRIAVLEFKAAANPVDATGADEVEKAQDDHEAAKDALADLEGKLAVLEAKAEAVATDEKKDEWQSAAAREDVEKAQRAVARARRKLGRSEARVDQVRDEVKNARLAVAAVAREELAKAQRAFARAGRKVETTATALDNAHARVEAESRALLQAMSVGGADEEEPPQARFATVELFVERFVLPNWNHKYLDKQARWCRKWWEHAEAITRLEALWEGFEVMRLQPAPSFSTWMRDHFDVHMRTLTDPMGVFYNCDSERGAHDPKPVWPADGAPEGMFATIDGAQIQAAAKAAADPSGSGNLSAPGGTTRTAEADRAAGQSSGNPWAAADPAHTSTAPLTKHTTEQSNGVRR